MGAIEGSVQARPGRARRRGAASAIAVAAMLSAMAGPAVAAADKKPAAPVKIEKQAPAKGDDKGAKDQGKNDKKAIEAAKKAGKSSDGSAENNGNSESTDNGSGNGSGNGTSAGAALPGGSEAANVPASAGGDTRITIDDGQGELTPAAAPAAKGPEKGADKADKGGDKAAKDQQKADKKAADDAKKAEHKADKPAKDDKGPKDKGPKDKPAKDKGDKNADKCAKAQDKGKAKDIAKYCDATPGKPETGTADLPDTAPADQAAVVVPISTEPSSAPEATVTQVLGETVTAPAAPAATAVKGAAIAAAPASNQTLPFTGSQSGLMALLAGGLVSLGAGCKLFGGRRRRTAQHD